MPGALRLRRQAVAFAAANLTSILLQRSALNRSRRLASGLMDSRAVKLRLGNLLRQSIDYSVALRAWEAGEIALDNLERHRVNKAKTAKLA